MLTVSLNMALFSCTPQRVSDNSPVTTEEGLACCGDGSSIPPPNTVN